MCQAMKDLMKDEIQEENQKAIDLDRVLSIKSLMEKLNLSAEQAMDALSIPLIEQKKYVSRL